MSKTKNTPEFEAMMQDQEMAASFDYQEKEALLDSQAEKELTYLQECEKIKKASDIYNQASLDFLEALKVFEEARKEYEGN